MQKNHITLLALLLVAVFALYIAWQQGLLWQATTPEEAESLGASLYQGAQNPIEEELGTTNPFEKSYKNPFE